MGIRFCSHTLPSGVVSSNDDYRTAIQVEHHQERTAPGGSTAPQLIATSPLIPRPRPGPDPRAIATSGEFAYDALDVVMILAYVEKHPAGLVGLR